MSEEITPYGGGDMVTTGGELALSRPPEKVLADAARAAAALKQVIEQTGASLKLGQSEHLKVEAWITLARFFNCAARIAETRLVTIGDIHGYEAFAQVVHLGDGTVVSSGEAMCMTDEPQWRERAVYEWRDGVRMKTGSEPVPLFQLRSMAQTRAISKACANAFRWVVVLAGFSGTPAEEMVGVALQSGQQPAASAPPAPPKRKVEPGADRLTLVGGVSNIQTKTGHGPSGKPYTLTRVTLTTGQTVATFDTRLAAMAQELQASGEEVEWLIRRTERGGYDIIDIIKPEGAASSGGDHGGDPAV